MGSTESSHQLLVASLLSHQHMALALTIHKLSEAEVTQRPRLMRLLVSSTTEVTTEISNENTEETTETTTETITTECCSRGRLVKSAAFLTYKEGIFNKNLNIDGYLPTDGTF